MKYRKKPAVIEAFRWMHHEEPEWWISHKHVEVVFESGAVFFETRKGFTKCDFGDWIIKDVEGEVYSCKHEIFLQIYEPVND